jgi:diguanylate cyclase (GGDEF)-like protein
VGVPGATSGADDGHRRATPEAFRDPEVIHALVNDGAVLFASLTGYGTISWISDSALPLLGWDPATISSRNAVELVHPDDQELLIDLLAEAMRGSADRSSAVLRLRHDAGRWCAFEFSGLDLRGEDGEGTYLVWGRPFEHVTRLLSFLDTLLADTDLPRILEHVIAWLDTLILESASAVLVRDDQGYRCLATSAALPLDLDLEAEAADRSFPWELAPTGDVVELDVDLDQLPQVIREKARAEGYEACWAVPVPTPEGDGVMAVVLTWRRRPGPTSVTQRRRLQSGAQVVRLAVEWARTQEQLLTAATTDALTGLANRSQFESRVLGERTPLAAVLLIDLDDFKLVNDHHGHLLGDELLRACARRMAAVVRGSDVLARLGGDEFAVWCPHLTGPEAAEALAQRLLGALEEPVDLDGTPHTVGCSIGVTLVEVEDPADRDLDQILGRADQALYRAKAAGKSRWAV